MVPGSDVARTVSRVCLSDSGCLSRGHIKLAGNRSTRASVDGGL